jgi:hypothetical protein
MAVNSALHCARLAHSANDRESRHSKVGAFHAPYELILLGTPDGFDSGDR